MKWIIIAIALFSVAACGHKAGLKMPAQVEKEAKKKSEKTAIKPASENVIPTEEQQ